MPRYVILLHELPSGHSLGDIRRSHWDLMLEREGTLATWALDEEPLAGRRCRAEQLADHRLAYLDYEGPISGNRGSVTRWDAGRYEIVATAPDELVIRVLGQRGPWRLVLQKSDAAHCWTVSFSAEPISG